MEKLSRAARISLTINDMNKRNPRASNKMARVLGAKKYAAMAAIEGLHLGTTSKKRLAKLLASDLPPDQRRAEVLRAYSSPKGRR